MPELPEVHVMVENLANSGLEGGVIAGIGGAERYMYPDAIEALVGSVFMLQPVTRKAKYIIFYTTNGVLLCHNKFTGYWDRLKKPWTFDYLEFKRDAGASTRDVRVEFDLVWPGDNWDRLRFHDARTLGVLEFYPGVTNPYEIKKLANMGPDVIETPSLDPNFRQVWEYSRFEECLRSTNQSIKLALLNQKYQAGIGNIAACEALHRVGINPTRSAKKLTTKDMEKLFEAIKGFMRLAISKSVKYDDYIDVFRRPICKVCRTAVVRIVQANRGTYLCPTCQPE